MKINGKPDGGGGGGVITGLSVSANGTYIATGGVDGYSPVNVSVPEQKPEETFSVTPSITEQTVTPQEGYVFSGGTVASVTSTIDGNIQAGNIKSGVTILGVEGNYTAPAPVTESLSVSVNGTYYPTQGVDGFSQVTVDVPQSVNGYTQRELTEGVDIVNVNNSADYVASYAFIGTNIQTVDLPEASYVGNAAFSECKSLATVNLPTCLSMGSYVFNACSSLTSISLPVCYSIGSTTFAIAGLSEIELPMLISAVSNLFRGDYLVSVSLPMCTNLANGTFQSCSNMKSLTLGTHNYNIVGFNYPFNGMNSNFLTSGTIYVNSEHYNSYITANGWSSFASRFVSVSLPDPVLSYSDGRIYGCTYAVYNQYLHEFLNIQKTSVTEIDLPECKYLNSRAFYGYGHVVSVNLQDVVYIGDNALDFSATILNLPKCLYVGNYGIYAGILTSISLPECRYLGIQALYYGSKLTSINLPKCKYIGSAAFNNCYSVSVYIGTNGVCTLGGTSLGYSFTGNIYVPASLVDEYKVAENWSLYSSRIFPIPE